MSISPRIHIVIPWYVCGWGMVGGKGWRWVSSTVWWTLETKSPMRVLTVHSCDENALSVATLMCAIYSTAVPLGTDSITSESLGHCPWQASVKCMFEEGWEEVTSKVPARQTWKRLHSRLFAKLCEFRSMSGDILFSSFLFVVVVFVQRFYFWFRNLLNEWFFFLRPI